MMLQIKAFINEFFWPTHCIFCKSKISDPLPLCMSCKEELPWNSDACIQCGNYLSEMNQTHCGKCLGDPPVYDHTFALFEFKVPITKLIHDFKFHEKFAYADVLGKLLTEKIQTDWYLNRTLPEAIIPVPLHIKRLRQRGYNQAIEIARFAAKKLSIKLDPFLCERIKETLPQSGLSGKARLKNINKAFICKQNQPYKHVAIIDDVITTGSTIKDIAQVLKKNGIQKIDVWCCARTHMGG